MSAIAEEILFGWDSMPGIVSVWVTIGWIYGELGDVERALEWNLRGIEAARVSRVA